MDFGINGLLQGWFNESKRLEISHFLLHQLNNDFWATDLVCNRINKVNGCSWTSGSLKENFEATVTFLAELAD